jgi:hypothetical protein
VPVLGYKLLIRGYDALACKKAALGKFIGNTGTAYSLHNNLYLRIIFYNRKILYKQGG